MSLCVPFVNAQQTELQQIECNSIVTQVQSCTNTVIACQNNVTTLPGIIATDTIILNNIDTQLQACNGCVSSISGIVASLSTCETNFIIPNLLNIVYYNCQHYFQDLNTGFIGVQTNTLCGYLCQQYPAEILPFYGITHCVYNPPV